MVAGCGQLSAIEGEHLGQWTSAEGDDGRQIDVVLFSERPMTARLFMAAMSRREATVMGVSKAVPPSARLKIPELI